jgi:hypothetical protein
MKKLAFFVLFALTGSLFLASCSKTDDPTVAKPKPTVTWLTTTDYKYADGSELAGNDVMFGILTSPSSGEKLTNVKITYSVDGGSAGILFDSTMKLATYTGDWTYKLGQLKGSKTKFTAVVTQSNGESASVSFTITATAPPRGVQANNGITMGGQTNNSFGSFLDPALGATGLMKYNEANDAPANVHLIYYYGANNKATFSAPSDIDIKEIFQTVSTWNPRNATLFKKTGMSASDFDNIDPSDATVIDQQCAMSTGGFGSKVTQLKVDDVIAYRKQDGSHYALLKVTAITVGSAGSITFDMVNPAF